MIPAMGIRPWTNIATSLFCAAIAWSIPNLVSQSALADAPAATAPSTSIANDAFSCDQGGFACNIDPQLTRNGQHVLLLTTQTTQPNRADATYLVPDPKAFLGKRVRFSAFLKSEKLINKGGIWLHALDAAGNGVAIADTFWQPVEGDVDHSLAGDNDWKKFQLVADIPAETTQLSVGMALNSSGRLWLDDARLEVVADDTPTTDDQNLHTWSLYPAAFTVSSDPATQRDGHPTLRIKSNAKTASEFTFGRYNRHADLIAGHRLHLSLWMKTEKLTGIPQIQIYGVGARDKYTQIDEHPTPVPAVGSSDWKKYDLFATVPGNPRTIFYCIDLTAQGALWVDEFQVEDTTDPAVSP